MLPDHVITGHVINSGRTLLLISTAVNIPRRRRLVLVLTSARLIALLRQFNMTFNGKTC